MGVMVKEELCQKVEEARTVSDSDDSCRVHVDADLLVCAMSEGRQEEKQSFYH